MNQLVKYTRKSKEMKNYLLPSLTIIIFLLFNNNLVANIWQHYDNANFIHGIFDQEITDNNYQKNHEGPTSCHGIIHASLGWNGYAIIEPHEMALSGDLTNSIVLINGVANDTLDCDDVGTTVRVTVLDTLTRQSCWGEALVEDKLAPVIECDTAFFYCTRDPRDPNLITRPDTVYDNCGDTTVTSKDGFFTEFNCDPTSIYAGGFTRTWTVTDGSGRSASCDQLVLFKRIHIDSIDIPVNDTMYCPNYSLDPAITGKPTFMGDTLMYTCNIHAYFTDTEWHGRCEGELKVIRKWTIRDFCANTVREELQKIMVFDTTPPVLVCPDTLRISTDSHNCSAIFTIPTIMAYDSCSHDSLLIFVNLSTHPGVFVPGIQVTLDKGTHILTYTVTDDCGNSSICEIVVVVSDQISPELTCTDINFPLGSNSISTLGVLKAGIITMKDFCGLDSVAFRRITSNCNRPQDLIFSDTIGFCCADVGLDIEVEYLAVDASGNRTVTSCFITVKGPNNMCQIAAPPDTTIFCNSLMDTMTLGRATVTDCMSNPIISFDDTPPSGGPCDMIITRTWSTMDVCGGVFTDEQIIHLIDSIAPIITFCPPADTTSCDMMDNFLDMVVATDNCTDSVDIVITSKRVDSGMMGVILFRYYAEDLCGNIDSCDQEITVIDTINPSVTCPVDIIISTEVDTCTAFVNISIRDSMDNCGIDSIYNSYTMTDDASGIYPLGTTIVKFIVIDIGGNTDTCEFTVTVVDSVPPVIVVENDTIDCNTDISDLSIFGKIVVSDNCTDTMDIDTIIRDTIMLNPCGSGTITRTITATDNSGNSSTMTQVIIIGGGVNSFDTLNIVCPRDTLIDCTSGTLPADLMSFVTLIDTAGLSCFDGAIISYKDSVINDPNVCVSIVREWIITDICSGMTFPCTQSILVDASGGPTFTFVPNNVTSTLASGQCDATVIVGAATAVGCGLVTITNDFNNNGPNISGVYPLDTTVVTFTATDACGNESTVSRTIILNPFGDLQIICKKTVIELIDGQFTVPADIFVLAIVNSCPLGAIYRLSFSPDPNDNMRTYMCADLGLEIISIYATDINGNQISCNDAEADVNDQQNFCTGPIIDVGGSIETAIYNSDLSDVEMTIHEREEYVEMSDDSGEYMFNEIETFGHVQIMPRKDGDFINGVNTLDLIKIQRHILHLDILPNPYHHIAADVNNDRRIDVLDLLTLQDVILYNKNQISENTSWRFITKEYLFNDIANPLNEEFPESLDYSELAEDRMENDFLAVKIGDLNGTAVSNANYVLSRGDSKILLNKQISKNGDLLLSFNESVSIEGFQLFLRFDNPVDNNLQIRFPDEDNLLNHFELIDDYTVGVLFGSKKESNFIKGIPIIEFSNIGGGNSDNDLKILLDSHSSEVYIGGRAYGLELGTRSNESDKLKLYQNYPNPFNNETLISFSVPDQGDVRFDIYDITGKNVYSKSFFAQRGFNDLIIKAQDVDGDGILYYEISTAEMRKVQKMLIHN